MKLLVVCLGNICRSPLAEGALRSRIAASPLAGRVEVDSAGTGDWHAGQPPDPRAIACARGHGVDISGQRARQIQAGDFDTFDWILCADEDNVRDVLRRSPGHARHKVKLLTEWAGVEPAQGIPDPYNGDATHFEQVWDLVDRAAWAVVETRCRQADCGIIQRSHE